jgi:hypothetical protein
MCGIWPVVCRNRCSKCPELPRCAMEVLMIVPRVSVQSVAMASGFPGYAMALSDCYQNPSNPSFDAAAKTLAGNPTGKDMIVR